MNNSCQDHALTSKICGIAIAIALASSTLSADQPTVERDTLRPERAVSKASERDGIAVSIDSSYSTELATVYENTGADYCGDAVVIPIPVGTPGDISTVVVIGDNTPATGPDCDSIGNGAPVWWEAFEIDS